jgi:MFS transporter, CP family, cyanate transporter
MLRVPPALLVVLGGISAALHIGKLPPALPVLGDALGITILQAGFLLSAVQLAGMCLGLVVGLAADGLGLKRTMVGGLALLSAASLVGAWADGPHALMILRAVEGLGFLLASMPAPSLIRRLVEPGRMSATLGLWGAYMPLGTALALLCGPVVMHAVGWDGWWILLGSFSLVASAWLWVALPPDIHIFGSRSTHNWPARLGQTLSSAGPWLVALAFAVYSAQWLAVIGFLPSMYAQAGLASGLSAIATAMAAAVNIVGNIASGRFLQRKVLPEHLLYVGFLAMAAGGTIAFADIRFFETPWIAAAVRYAGVLLFSMVGGLIPGTLFSLAVRLAPTEHTVSTTVGWMQQWSSTGQFVGPPLVAWVATRAGGWQWSWWVTASLAIAGLVLARLTSSVLHRRRT